MYNLVRFYNQNRKAIIRFIIIVVLLFILLQILNTMAKKGVFRNNNKDYENVDNNSTLGGEVLSNQSAVGGRKINSNELKEDTSIIKEFLDYCNNGEIENAYNMISNSSRNNDFLNIEDFISIYIEPIFNNRTVIYTIENWANKTYKIKISDDIIATGNLNEGFSKIDYITVTEEEGEKRLNINGLIENKQINRQASYKGLTVSVVEENIYMDYTTFTFDIINDSSTAVLLDKFNNIDTMYIQDDSGVKYFAYTNELSERDMFIDSKSKNRITIKYFSKYNSTRVLNNIVFSNVILNYIGNDNINDFSVLSINI